LGAIILNFGLQGVMGGIDVVGSIVECACFAYFIDDFKLRSKSSTFRYISVMLFFTLVALISRLDFTSKVVVRALFTITIMYVYYRINYDIEFRRGIFEVLLYFMILIIIDTVTINILKYSNVLTGYEIMWEANRYRLQLIIIAKLMLFITVRYAKKSKLINHLSAIDIVYLTIPIITNLATFLIMFQGYGLYFGKVSLSDLHIMIITFILLAANAVLLGIILHVIKENKELEQSQLENIKRDMEYEYYRKIEENNQNVRKMYHDMKKYLSHIETLCTNEKTDKYISSLRVTMNQFDNIYNTGNTAIDAILNEKSSLCLDNNIKMFVSVNKIQKNIENEDNIIEMLSNFIDHFINGCIAIEDESKSKIISLNLNYDEGSSKMKIKCESTIGKMTKEITGD
jgi:hypothetical protein